MCCGKPGDGAFPVSYQLGWHGGVHLTAPAAGNGSATEHVRAIADGTVIFVRKPTPHVDDPAHPLNYCGWTDDGCIVLRHRTSIGQGEHAESVEFFSVYMHLAAVQPAIAKGRKVYRKADLGQAGQIYGGNQRKIHFEIVCDDTNLRRLTGRTGGALDIERDGRTDSVFGALYFLLPAGTQVFGRAPVPHLTVPHYQPPRPKKDAPLPQLEPNLGHCNQSLPTVSCAFKRNNAQIRNCLARSPDPFPGTNVYRDCVMAHDERIRARQATKAQRRYVILACSSDAVLPALLWPRRNATYMGWKFRKLRYLSGFATGFRHPRLRRHANDTYFGALLGRSEGQEGRCHRKTQTLVATLRPEYHRYQPFLFM